MMNYTGSWVWDVACDEPAYWSPEMCRLHGRSAALGLPTAIDYREFFPASDWSAWLSAIERSAREKANLDIASRLRLPDGSFKHIRMTGYPVVGAEGRVTEIMGTASEISDVLPLVQHAAEEPFRETIDMIPALVWSSRADGAAESFNRVWLDYTGLSTEEALEWGWTKAIHPDDINGMVAYWQQILPLALPAEIEARLRRHDGQYRWFLFRATPLVSESGEVIKWYGTNTDIEDRKRAEDALRASELNFRLIVDTIPALVCTMTPAGAVEIANQQTLTYFGKTRDELQDWASIGAVHEDDLPAVGARWLHSIETGEPYDVEHRIRHVDGSYRWFHVRGLPLRDNAGNIVRWYILLMDIDDRKKAEDALREREGELRQLVETIPALLWRGTAQGELDYLNQRHVDFIGRSLEETVGRQWVELIDPEHRDSAVRRWLHSVTTGAPYEDVYRIRRADGNYRWIQSTAQPFRDREGRIVHWYGMVVDIDDRKNAEDAARESERELRQLVDSVPGMIAVANARGEHEYANKRALDYTGTTVEESRGLGFIQTIHPDDQEFVKVEWMRSNALIQPMDIQHRWRRHDGQYRWFHVRVDPLRDEQGQVVRWYGLLTDVEDQHRLEESLRKSEQHLRALVETIPALLWRATPEGELDYVNRRVLEYTGATIEELLQLGWSPYIHRDDVDEATRTWRESCETGASHEVIQRLRRADGEYRWFQVRCEPLRNPDGSILNWYGLMLDIDDRKRAEQSLREREDALRLITETIPAIVTSRAASGKLDYVNQRLVEYTGKSAQEIIDSGVDLIHPNDRESLLGVWRDSQASGEPYQLDYRMRRRDGVHRWFRVRGAPLRDRHGTVIRWYGVITDIDDEKHATEDLVRSQARLARMSQLMTVAELSASIAHEVNQPLAAAVANGHACLSWLSSEPPNVERARLTAERIIRNGNAAADVVRRIRALFKQAPPEMALCPINDILVEALRLLADEARRAGILIEADLASDLPPILADRVQIQHVQINLVQNAIDAMAGIGDRPKSLHLRSQRAGGEILVQVRDTGCGIANPTALFDPFFTTKENGMGMGLAICRSIIEAHGGRLWATSNESAGATFSFTLPIQQEVQV